MTPRLWDCLTLKCLRIDAALARAWWQALVHARWSEAVAFRQGLLLFEQRPPSRQSPEEVEAFWAVHLQPKQLIALIENLWKEGRLRRHRATMLEEHVLAMVQANGEWK